MTLVDLDDIIKYLENLENSRAAFDYLDPVPISWIIDRLEGQFREKEGEQ